MPAAGPSLDFEGFPSLADIEVAAIAYVTGQKLCVFKLLIHHEVPISRAGIFVGIESSRGQRLLYSRRRRTSSTTEHHELAAAAAEGSC